MIKNIIFDIGWVLIDFDPDTYMKGFGFEPEKEKLLRETVFGGSLWRDLDRGLKPIPQIREELVTLVSPEYRDDILSVFDHSSGTIRKRKYAIPWIRELQSDGFQTYYLSNYSLWLIERTRDALDFLPLMRNGLFSYEVGLLKPEPEIFRAFLERCPEVIPDESIFFDDSAKNVEAACALGFHGIVFESQAQAVQEMIEFFLRGEC